MTRPDTERRVIIKRGDTLYKIARRVTGDGDRWIEIWRHNMLRSRSGNPSLIHPGEVFEYPPEWSPRDTRAEAERLAAKRVATRREHGCHYAEGTCDECLEIARAALSAIPADDGWRPISEYPADCEGWGPNVLLFVPSGVVAPSSDYRIVVGRLEADMWLSWNDRDEMFDIEGKPTHWMLLPSPPDDGGRG